MGRVARRARPGRARVRGRGNERLSAPDPGAQGVVRRRGVQRIRLRGGRRRRDASVGGRRRQRRRLGDAAAARAASSPRAPYGETRFRRAKKKKTFRRRSALCRRPCWRARWRRWRRRRTSTSRAAMCATWARRALGVETTTDSRTGSGSSLPRVDSSVSATSASSAASEGTNADAGEAGEAGDAGEAGFDTLETAFGFETFDAAEKISAESDDERAPRRARGGLRGLRRVGGGVERAAAPPRGHRIGGVGRRAPRRRRRAEILRRPPRGVRVGADRRRTTRRGSRPDDDDFFQTRATTCPRWRCASRSRAPRRPSGGGGAWRSGPP